MDELFTRLTRNLIDREPDSMGVKFAAVAMIVQDRTLPRVLLIRRAERTGDPWSGQIAFPGGKAQPEDKSAKDTAVRETLEEVGIDLRMAEFLGYGAPARTHTGTMDVVPAVFELKREPEITPNGEVYSFRWVGLKEILSRESRFTYRLERLGDVAQLPAYKVGDYVVWGLTHRILSSILGDDD